MEKKIPKVYANKIDKDVGNNDRIYYGSNQEKITEEPKKNNNLNINQKINKIFSSPNYVYKADVVITLKDKTVTKKIIGRNKNSLITFDNELINVSDIIDIDYK